MFRELTAVAVAASAAACYSSNPATGSPCDDGTQCPPGLECSPASLTCERSAVDARRVDSPPTDAMNCIGDGYTRYCFDSLPTNTVELASPAGISTDPGASAFCSADFADVCMVAGGTISIGAMGTATGTRPLVLVATTTITVEAGGTIDVASHDGTTVGAGADPSDCVAGTPPVMFAGNYGGSFGGIGGSGGRGSAGATGGMPPPAITPSSLRGGCAGGNGSGSNPTAGGQGGGAVALVAGTSVTIAGQVNASGTRGGGSASGLDGAGGAGGGSGGLIVLDAPTLIVSGLVIANGGGGGEGTDGLSVGNPGSDPDLTNPTTPARGGSNGSPFGGDGGAGAAGAIAAAVGSNGGGGIGTGGGGGGGGAGYIHTTGTLMNTGTISPGPPVSTAR